MELGQVTQRQSKLPLRLALESEDTAKDEAFTAYPVEPMNSRSVFLLTMAVTSFAAFTLFVLAELTHHHPSLILDDVLQGDTHATSEWVLLVAVPVTSAAAWFPITASYTPAGMLRIMSAVPPLSPDSPSLPEKSIATSLLTKLMRRYRRNYMFAIYQSIGWTSYVLFVTLQLICFSFDSVHDLQFCQPGSRSMQAVAAFIAEVLIISSVLTLEKRRDRNRQLRKDRFVVQLNNFNNMLLLVGATLLALASEYTRVFPHPSGSSVGYPMATGLGSLALFITALLNTYNLGGVLSTKDGWNFYQPFMGGARFVLFQFVSWTCFAAGFALQLLYLISLVVVEMELFVGIMAAAGSLFVVAEIGMMMSLLVFHTPGRSPKRSSETVHATRSSARQTAAKPKILSLGTIDDTTTTASSPLYKRLRNFADECLGILVVGGLANIHWTPNVLCFAFFAITTNLSPAGVMLYGIMASGVEGVMMLSRSVAMHMYMKDSQNGLLTEINRYHVKYVLPQILSPCVPAVATYRHYVDDMEAFVPVLILTILIYSYEFTYRGNPAHTGCRERASWVTGSSILMETVRRYFSGRIIRMAPLDPSKQYVLSFHPHGIVPTSAMWLQFTAEWRALFPNFCAHVLTASVLHQLPLGRDVLQFLGSREVTR